MEANVELKVPDFVEFAMEEKFHSFMSGAYVGILCLVGIFILCWLVQIMRDRNLNPAFVPKNPASRDVNDLTRI